MKKRNTDTRDLANKQLRRVYKVALEKFCDEELDDVKRAHWGYLLEAIACGGNENEKICNV